MHRESSWNWASLIVLFLVSPFVILSGCSGGPAAPVLSDAPVYRNSTEGFRFLVPEGWTQTASSTLPSGKLDSEIFLVRYRVTSPEAGATLQILCKDDDKSVTAETHHSGASFRAKKWDVKEPLAPIEINKAAAERIIYQVKVDDREMTKHVTCFHRNDRLYSFVGLYFSNDDKARQQIERAVESIIWE